MLPSSLQISVVTYRPDLKLLERCLRKLALAIAAGREAGVMRTVHLALIDNSEDKAVADTSSSSASRASPIPACT